MALAVADASVVAKWFLEEADSEAARRLRDDYLEGALRIRVPSLLPFEVMNALRFHSAFPRRNLGLAARALDRASLPTVPLFGEYLERTMVVCLEHDLTVYDASYVALAELGQCPLYTADKALADLELEVTRIVHVREYPSGVRS